MLNLYNFNGCYGCHYCTVEGITIGSSHCYYPFAQTCLVREPTLTNKYVRFADVLSFRHKPNVAGVKGKSAFANMIEGLPLSAPIDYMHCELLGVFRNY